MAGGYRHYTDGETRYPIFVRRLLHAPAYLRDLADVDEYAELAAATSVYEPQLEFDGPVIDVCGMLATVLRAVLRPARNKHTAKLLAMHNNRRLSLDRTRLYVLRINNIEYGVPNTISYFLHVIFTLVGLGEPWDDVTRPLPNKSSYVEMQNALIAAASEATANLGEIRTLVDTHQNGATRPLPPTMMWNIFRAIDTFAATVFDLVKDAQPGAPLAAHVCSRCHTQLADAPTRVVTVGISETFTREFVTCTTCETGHVPISRLLPPRVKSPAKRKRAGSADMPSRPAKRSYKDTLRLARKRAAALDAIPLPE